MCNIEKQMSVSKVGNLIQHLVSGCESNQLPCFANYANGLALMNSMNLFLFVYHGSQSVKINSKIIQRMYYVRTYLSKFIAGGTAKVSNYYFMISFTNLYIY